MFGHAFRNVGAECVAVSEIDDHASAVTRYHYPDIINLGDVRNAAATDFDCLLGGWPCQGNSVAGNRRGMADPRSGLFGEIVRILGASSPRWFLLENNPGLFSVNERRDFGACIGALGELGYAVGWRVLDAQYFRVPQRRRRIFFVGCLGDPRRTAEVLFEPESVRGDSPPRREAGEGSAGDIAKCLTTSCNRIDAETETLIVDGFGSYRRSDQCGTLRASGGDGAGGSEALVVDLAQVTSRTSRSNPQPGDPSPTLAATGRPMAYNWRQPDSMPNALSPALDTDSSIAVGPRRLMPIECERLQGLPDDWTRYGRKPDGTVYEISDSARYHMIGNGGAVPVVEWIGRRMMEIERQMQEVEQ